MSEHVIWNELGTLHFNAGAYDQAIKAYTQAVELESEFGLAFQNLALAHAKKGNFSQAIQLYKKSLKLMDNTHDKACLWKHLGDAYRQIHERENAMDAYQKAIDLAPENAAFNSELALLLQELLQSGEEQHATQPQPDAMESVPLSADHAVDPADWGTESSSQEATSVSTLDGGSASPSTGLDSYAIEPAQEILPESDIQVATVPANAPDPVPDNAPEESNPNIDMALSSQPDLDSQKAGHFMQVFIEQIYPNPHQPRTHIDASDLVDSIREYGIIQPLVVARTDVKDKYTLISGERRLEAARQVGLNKVPVFVREVSQEQLLELALIENVCRSNLSPLEQAKALKRLSDEFNMSDAELAAHTGKSRVAVANSIRLARLPENLMHALDSRRISESHAQALLSLPTMELQIGVLQQILDADLSVRQTEALVRKQMTELQNVESVDENTAMPVSKGVQPESEVETQVEPFEEALSEEPDEFEHETEMPLAVEQVDLMPEEDKAVFDIDETETVEKVEPETVIEETDLTEVVESDMEDTEAPESVEVESVDDSEPQLESELENTVIEISEPESQSLDRIRSSSVTYKKVTEMNPDNDKAWEILGSLYVSLGEFENAASAYQQAVAINPGNVNYHFRLGQALVFQKKYEDAVEKFKQVLEFDEEHVFARCALAGSLRHLGLDDEALQHLEIAAPQMQVEREYNRACFEAISGNPDGAVDLLIQALESGQTTMEQIQTDPDLEFIKDEPRFLALLEGETCVA